MEELGWLVSRGMDGEGERSILVYRVRLVGSRCWCLGEDESECEISLKSEELSWRMFVGEQLFFCGNC
jgi:hypothetical protein